MEGGVKREEFNRAHVVRLPTSSVLKFKIQLRYWVTEMFLAIPLAVTTSVLFAFGPKPAPCNTSKPLSCGLLPTGNGLHANCGSCLTNSAFTVQGTTNKSETREFLVNFGLTSNMGAYTTKKNNINDKVKCVLPPLTTTSTAHMDNRKSLWCVCLVCVCIHLIVIYDPTPSLL